MKRLGVSLLLCCIPSVALADTLQVGPGKAYPDPCAAVAKAASGDVIEVDPGTYIIACKVGVSLTVRGVGDARPVLQAAIPISNGKGIFAVEGPEVDFVAERLEFTGATVGDQNGAGIRFQGRNLTVRGCLFHDNDDGILSSGTGEELVEGSEFHDNGFGDGQSHNLYMGASSKFIFRYNWTRSSRKGHLLKSRAKENWILFNRITEETETESDNLNLPSGGKSYVIGNLFEQIDSANGNMVRFGVEGNQYGADSAMFMVHNTFINRRNKGAFLIVDPSVSQPSVVANNLFFGQGSLPSDQVTSVGNVMRALTDLGADLVNDAGFDYHLKPGAAAVDQGVDVSAYLGGIPLEQYIHAFQHAPRTQQGAAPDSGAYELGDSGQGGSGGASGSSGQGGSAGDSGQGGASAGAGQGGTGESGSSGQGGTGQAGSGGTGQSGAGGTGQGGAGAGGSGQAGGPAGGAAGSGATGGAAGSGQGGSTAGSGTAGSGTAGSGTAGTAGKGGAAGKGGSSASGASGQAGSGEQASAAGSEDDGGCGCRTSGASSRAGAGWALVALLGGLVRRRRSVRRG